MQVLEFILAIGWKIPWQSKEAVLTVETRAEIASNVLSLWRVMSTLKRMLESETLSETVAFTSTEFNTGGGQKPRNGLASACRVSTQSPHGFQRWRFSKTSSRIRVFLSSIFSIAKK